MAKKTITAFPYNPDYTPLPLSADAIPIDERSDFVIDMLDRLASMPESDDFIGETVRPDKFGCYSQFGRKFISEDMEYDFPLIARAFLKHEANNLDKYNETSYMNSGGDSTYPAEHYSFQIFSLMLNALQQGNEFTRQLFISIYKTYYKKEYKQLKRFRSIKAREVLSIADNEYYGEELAAIARILCMCEIMNIEILPSCDFLYSLLNRVNERWEDNLENETYFLEFPDGLFPECLRWVEAQNAQIKHRTHVTLSPAYKPYSYAQEICEMAFRHNGFIAEYAYINSRSFVNTNHHIAYVKTMMQMRHPKVEFTFAELQMLSVIYFVTASYCDCVIETNEFINNLFGFYSGEFNLVEHLWNEDMIPAIKQQESPTSPGNTATKAAPTTVIGTAAGPTSENSIYKEEDLLKEVDSLRKRLHKKEMDYEYLKQLYDNIRKSDSEIATRLANFEDEHDELVALREHVFNSTEDDLPLEPESISAMQDAISAQKLVIIGGRTNWIGKLRNIFPNWIFINSKVSGSIDERILNDADYVYFYTDYIKHSTYYKFVHIVREKHISFGYIHSSNIERNIKQIYEDLN